MNTEYAKAFKEVLSILDQVQKKEKNKIPDDFLTFYKNMQVKIINLNFVKIKN